MCMSEICAMIIAFPPSRSAIQRQERVGGDAEVDVLSRVELEPRRCLEDDRRGPHALHHDGDAFRPYTLSRPANGSWPWHRRWARIGGMMAHDLRSFIAAYAE